MRYLWALSFGEKVLFDAGGAKQMAVGALARTRQDLEKKQAKRKAEFKPN